MTTCCPILAPEAERHGDFTAAEVLRRGEARFYRPVAIPYHKKAASACAKRGEKVAATLDQKAVREYERLAAVVDRIVQGHRMLMEIPELRGPGPVKFGLYPDRNLNPIPNEYIRRRWWGDDSENQRSNRDIYSNQWRGLSTREVGAVLKLHGLRHPQEDARFSTVMVLADLGERDAVLSALSDSASQVRLSAAKALASMRWADGWAACYEHADEDVRSAVAPLFVKFRGDVRARTFVITELIQGLNSTLPGANSFCQSYLQRITGKNLSEAQAWLAWWEEMGDAQPGLKRTGGGIPEWGDVSNAPGKWKEYRSFVPEYQARLEKCLRLGKVSQARFAHMEFINGIWMDELMEQEDGGFRASCGIGLKKQGNAQPGIMETCPGVPSEIDEQIDFGIWWQSGLGSIQHRPNPMVEYQLPATIEWRGHLVVTQPGHYQFYVRNRGESIRSARRIRTPGRYSFPAYFPDQLVKLEIDGRTVLPRSDADAGVSPLKTLGSVLLQIPLFIIAFLIIQATPVFSRKSFLWISDLSRPDQVARIPKLLWFGSHFNLLPLLLIGSVWIFSMIARGSGQTIGLFGQIVWLLLAIGIGVLTYRWSSALLLFTIALLWLGIFIRRIFLFVDSVII